MNKGIKMRVEISQQEINEMLQDMSITQEDADKMLLSKEERITFRRCIMRGLDFSNRDLRGVYFSGIVMEHISFKGSNLENASFYKTVMDDIDFTHANLRKTLFVGATLSNINLTSIEAPLWKKVYLYSKNR